MSSAATPTLDSDEQQSSQKKSSADRSLQKAIDGYATRIIEGEDIPAAEMQHAAMILAEENGDTSGPEVCRMLWRQLRAMPGIRGVNTEIVRWLKTF